MAWRVWCARSWIAVPCAIRERRIDQHRDGDAWRVVARYGYRLDGIDRIGDRLDFAPGFSPDRAAMAWDWRWQPVMRQSAPAPAPGAR